MARIDPVKYEPWLGKPGMHYPTGIVYETAKKTIHKGQLLPDGKVAQADTAIYDGQYSVTAAWTNNTPQPWQYSPVVVSPGEVVSITAQGQWSVIGRNLNGPGGHAGIVAHGPGIDGSTGKKGSGFLLANGQAIEGCLLVQDGAGNIQAFLSDHATVYVSAPGRILFSANDETVPIDGHLGFSDNSGSLIVTVDFFGVT